MLALFKDAEEAMTGPWAGYIYTNLKQVPAWSVWKMAHPSRHDTPGAPCQQNVSCKSLCGHEVYFRHEGCL